LNKNYITLAKSSEGIFGAKGTTILPLTNQPGLVNRKRLSTVGILGTRGPGCFSSCRTDDDIGGSNVTVGGSTSNNNSVSASHHRALIPPISFTGRIHMVQVAFGIGIIGPLFVGVELWNGYSREDPDDGDHDQQLNQGEASLAQWQSLATKTDKSVLAHLSILLLNVPVLLLFR